MRVSVLMPTYNQARFLQRSLDGIANQIYRDFELIVCNDGSTDGTADMLGSVCCVHHETNEGAASAINSAREWASGELLTWVSSDNVMHPDWLICLVDHLDEHPNHGAVYSDYVRCEKGTMSAGSPGAYAPERLISSENCYFGPSFLIRRDVWQEHRGLSAHDFDNWSRVEEECWHRGLSIGYEPRILCDYHAGPWCTARARPELYDAAKWRREAIERRELAR
jgi:glycosyltransferase involved in cell wall biosynthesis